ncbi:MAG: hypothetical protein DRI44_07650 [Chlamydiae bacterium]|nr:MAG: hypothetical protein DRI44_07650 [Chlamydiota bacterium]
MAFRGCRDEDAIEMNLSSMVDIVFLLLIYFIVSASLIQDESELKVAIPVDNEAKNEQRIDSPEEVVVDIFPTGEVYWNGQPTDSSKSVDLPELKTILYDLKQAYPEQPVVIRGQRDTKHQRVVSVLNACSYAGIDQISFPSDASVFE